MEGAGYGTEGGVLAATSGNARNQGTRIGDRWPYGDEFRRLYRGGTWVGRDCALVEQAFQACGIGLEKGWALALRCLDPGFQYSEILLNFSARLILSAMVRR
jgi:hypothetical protein